MKVVFVSMDTVRAARLSTFGSRSVRTPNLDRLASEGTAFTRAFATDIPTQPSHTALFTGRYGINSGIVSHFHPPANLGGDATWLPSILQGAGCRTGAVDHLFSMKEWFIRGYEDYMVPEGKSRSPGSVINAMGFPWLDAHRDDDFYLFMHFWDAHIPYLPPAPFFDQYTARSRTWRDPQIDEKLRTRPTYPLFAQNNYDPIRAAYGDIPNLDFLTDLHLAEVAYLDHEIGRLADHLAELGILDEVTWVLFGDHGEVMTEHDSWFDHAGLYDSVTHVPLIIRAPGRMPVARVDDMVALVDVLPTVLELLDLPIPEGIDGRSLVPLARGEQPGHRSEIVMSESTWEAKRAVRTERFKLVRCYDPGLYPCDRTELFDLAADPDEQRNVAAERPDVVDQLDARLDAWLAEQLAGRPDPLLEVVGYGLPAVRRLADLVRGSPQPAACTPLQPSTR